jgi:mannose-6-phosphate isomerase-like protein (cupin superfamily)
MDRLEPPHLRPLLAALRTQFEEGRARKDAIGDEIRAVSVALSRLSEPEPADATHHPLTRYLPVAIALSKSNAPDVVSVLAPLANSLPWRYGYAPRADVRGLESAMGWAEIVGPKAPFHSDEVCFGLTLIGPQIYYPPHHHPAKELYFVLAGRAAWTAEQTAILPPGAYILHEPDIVHAMRTREEPLLAIYSWTGDVVSPSAWAGERHAGEASI